VASLRDGHYEVKSFATDAGRNNVALYGVFHGTHTGAGGPVPPTGRCTSTDYVHVMPFEGDKIVHMIKIRHAGLAMKELGWSWQSSWKRGRRGVPLRRRCLFCAPHPRRGLAPRRGRQVCVRWSPSSPQRDGSGRSWVTGRLGHLPYCPSLTPIMPRELRLEHTVRPEGRPLEPKS
jgi:hypothetical protein